MSYTSNKIVQITLIYILHHVAWTGQGAKAVDHPVYNMNLYCVHNVKYYIFKLHFNAKELLQAYITSVLLTKASKFNQTILVTKY